MAFIRAGLLNVGSMRELCAQCGISRKTGYKWLARYHQTGRRGLRDQSRQPRRPHAPVARRWRRRVLVLHRRYRSWGARKLLAKLRQRYPRQRRPARRTMQRWLDVWLASRPRRRRVRSGPVLPPLLRAVARRPNDVWTLDFKGCFRTGDGGRVHPLTVRDLHSRFLLAVRALPDQSDARVRAVLRRVFLRHGLPKVIRVDNGVPFAGTGALGWSRLSVWWQRLGIRVEFTRRGHPEDNAGHEQMHGVYQRDNTRPPARSLAAQQRREARWRQVFNHERPHQALREAVPATRYVPSQRRLPRRLLPLRYRAGWPTRWVDAKGYIYWAGRRRVIGRAFAGQRVGFKPGPKKSWEVYLGQQLVGTLHTADAGGLRPARQAVLKRKV
jgi:transposase InsO family protein